MTSEQLEQRARDADEPDRIDASVRSSSTKGFVDLDARSRASWPSSTSSSSSSSTSQSIEIAAALLLSESLARRYRALADPLPRRRLHARRGRRSDQRDVLRRAAARGRDADPHLRRRARTIDAAITRLNDDAAVAIEEFVSDALESEDTASVLDLNHDTPSVVFVNRSISKALDLGASDIHFTPQQRRLFVRVRVDGVMRELTSIPGTQARLS